MLLTDNTNQTMETSSRGQEMQHDGPALQTSLSAKVGRVLGALASIGDRAMGALQTTTAFHSSRPADIPVHAYFVYVTINAGLSDNQAIIPLIMMERICNKAHSKGVPLAINSLTIHR